MWLKEQTDSMEEIFREGFLSYKPNANVYDANPYKKYCEFGPPVNGNPIISLQIEATFFFNGWDLARRCYYMNDKFNIFLDDYRFPNQVSWINLPNVGWAIARHFYQFVGLIKEYGIPKYISWDYDLDRHGLDIKGLPNKTGGDCLKWLIKYCKDNKLQFPRSTVHSTSENRNEIIDLIGRVWPH